MELMGPPASTLQGTDARGDGMRPAAPQPPVLPPRVVRLRLRRRARHARLVLGRAGLAGVAAASLVAVPAISLRPRPRARITQEAVALAAPAGAPWPGAGQGTGMFLPVAEAGVRADPPGAGVGRHRSRAAPAARPRRCRRACRAGRRSPAASPRWSSTPTAGRPARCGAPTPGAGCPGGCSPASAGSSPGRPPGPGRRAGTTRGDDPRPAAGRRRWPGRRSSATPTAGRWTSTRPTTGPSGRCSSSRARGALFASDGNGDGRSDPPTCTTPRSRPGRYLCASGGDLRTPTGLATAVLSYNYSTSYLSAVLGWGLAYRDGVWSDRAVPRLGAAPAASEQPAAHGEHRAAGVLAATRTDPQRTAAPTAPPTGSAPHDVRVTHVRPRRPRPRRRPPSRRRRRRPPPHPDHARRRPRPRRRPPTAPPTIDVAPPTTSTPDRADRAADHDGPADDRAPDRDRRPAHDRRRPPTTAPPTTTAVPPTTVPPTTEPRHHGGPDDGIVHERGAHPGPDDHGAVADELRPARRSGRDAVPAGGALSHGAGHPSAGCCTRQRRPRAGVGPQLCVDTSGDPVSAGEADRQPQHEGADRPAVSPTRVVRASSGAAAGPSRSGSAPRRRRCPAGATSSPRSVTARLPGGASHAATCWLRPVRSCTTRVYSRGVADPLAGFGVVAAAEVQPGAPAHRDHRHAGGDRRRHDGDEVTPRAPSAAATGVRAALPFRGQRGPQHPGADRDRRPRRRRPTARRPAGGGDAGPRPRAAARAAASPAGERRAESVTSSSGHLGQQAGQPGELGHRAGAGGAGRRWASKAARSVGDRAPRT